MHLFNLIPMKERIVFIVNFVGIGSSIFFQNISTCKF